MKRLTDSLIYTGSQTFYTIFTLSFIYKACNVSTTINPSFSRFFCKDYGKIPEYLYQRNEEIKQDRLLAIRKIYGIEKFIRYLTKEEKDELIQVRSGSIKYFIIYLCRRAHTNFSSNWPIMYKPTKVIKVLFRIVI